MDYVPLVRVRGGVRKKNELELVEKGFPGTSLLGQFRERVSDVLAGLYFDRRNMFESWREGKGENSLSLVMCGSRAIGASGNHVALFFGVNSRCGIVQGSPIIAKLSGARDSR